MKEIGTHVMGDVLVVEKELTEDCYETERSIMCMPGFCSVLVISKKLYNMLKENKMLKNCKVYPVETVKKQ